MIPNSGAHQQKRVHSNSESYAKIAAAELFSTLLLAMADSRAVINDFAGSIGMPNKSFHGNSSESNALELSCLSVRAHATDHSFERAETIGALVSMIISPSLVY